MAANGPLAGLGCNETSSVYRGASHGSVLLCFPQSCRVCFVYGQTLVVQMPEGLHAREERNSVVMLYRMIPSGIETPSGDNLFNPHVCSL